jgi:hypothetical protein
MAPDKSTLRHVARRAAASGVILAAALFVAVDAHDAHVAGPYRLGIGWSDEPAFTGIPNAVFVEITEVGKGPLTDPASLTVEVSFGAERIVLPLNPAPARRHVFQAPLVPTRPGTYTFHLTGKVRNQPIDITTTCSEKTFDCVQDGSAIQFPVKDPPAGQVVERLERSLPRAELALASAKRAETMAAAAIGVAALALLSLAVGVKRTRKSG